jgi:hypothetical protein
MYCGSCGTQLNSGAKFCRSCGTPQSAGAALPPPPPPTASGLPQARVQTTVLAGLLATAGGAAFFLLTIFATVYQPLHYDSSVNYGESVQFGDVLVLVAGVVAAILGLLLLMRPGNNVARGWGLLVAGVPVFVLTAVWAFKNLYDLASEPFYIGFVFFADFGRVETDTHLIQVPLLIAGAMVIGAGLLALSAPRPAPPPR